MSDLISRKAAIDIMQAEGDVAQGASRAVFYRAARMLELLPAMDAEPVRHGKWINAGHDAFTQYRRCSSCARILANAPAYDYCPNCGAKMDGDEKNV